MATYRKRTYKRKGKKGRSSGLSKKQIGQVKRIANKNVEFKRLDDSNAGIPLASGTAPTPFDAISTADGRVGLVATIKSIAWKFDIVMSATNPIGNVYPTIRIIVFSWRSLTPPALSDILEDPSLTNSVLSPLKNSNTRFIKIHMDRRLTMAINSAKACYHFNKYMKQNKKIRYDDTIPSAPASNNLLWRVILSNQNTANTQPLLTEYTRVNYVDA